MTRRYIGIDKDEEVKAITKFTNKLKKRKEIKISCILSKI